MYTPSSSVFPSQGHLDFSFWSIDHSSIRAMCRQVRIKIVCSVKCFLKISHCVKRFSLNKSLRQKAFSESEKRCHAEWHLLSVGDQGILSSFCYLPYYPCYPRKTHWGCSSSERGIHPLSEKQRLWWASVRGTKNVLWSNLQCRWIRNLPISDRCHPLIKDYWTIIFDSIFWSRIICFPIQVKAGHMLKFKSEFRTKQISWHPNSPEFSLF